jgi:hypothetical protein
MHWTRKLSFAMAKNIAIKAPRANHTETNAEQVATSHTRKNTNATAQNNIIAVAVILFTPLFNYTSFSPVKTIVPHYRINFNRVG